MIGPPETKEPAAHGARTGSGEMSGWAADDCGQITARHARWQALGADGLFPDLAKYQTPRQAQIDWLKGEGVTIDAMIRPEPIRVAFGRIGHASPRRNSAVFFDDDANGERWLVIPEDNDCLYWNPRSGRLAAFNGTCFALGENLIGNASVCALGQALHIYATPLHWLQARRKGIVVLPWQWPAAFDKLRDVERIAIGPELRTSYEHHMKPARLPRLFIRDEAGRVAA